jgi:hypothetical protein
MMLFVWHVCRRYILYTRFLWFLFTGLVPWFTVYFVTVSDEVAGLPATALYACWLWPCASYRLTGQLIMFKIYMCIYVHIQIYLDYTYVFHYSCLKYIQKKYSLSLYVHVFMYVWLSKKLLSANINNAHETTQICGKRHVFLTFQKMVISVESFFSTICQRESQNISVEFHLIAARKEIGRNRYVVRWHLILTLLTATIRWDDINLPVEIAPRGLYGGKPSCYPLGIRQGSNRLQINTLFTSNLS